MEESARGGVEALGTGQAGFQPVLSHLWLCDLSKVLFSAWVSVSSSVNWDHISTYLTRLLLGYGQ